MKITNICIMILFVCGSGFTALQAYWGFQPAGEMGYGQYLGASDGWETGAASGMINPALTSQMEGVGFTWTNIGYPSGMSDDDVNSFAFGYGGIGLMYPTELSNSYSIFSENDVKVEISSFAVGIDIPQFLYTFSESYRDKHPDLKYHFALGFGSMKDDIKSKYHDWRDQSYSFNTECQDIGFYFGTAAEKTASPTGSLTVIRDNAVSLVISNINDEGMFLSVASVEYAHRIAILNNGWGADVFPRTLTAQIHLGAQMYSNAGAGTAESGTEVQAGFDGAVFDVLHLRAGFIKNTETNESDHNYGLGLRYRYRDLFSIEVSKAWMLQSEYSDFTATSVELNFNFISLINDKTKS